MAILTEKTGPLPNWAWVGGGGVAIAVGMALLAGRKEKPQPKPLTEGFQEVRVPEPVLPAAGTPIPITIIIPPNETPYPIPPDGGQFPIPAPDLEQKCVAETTADLAYSAIINRRPDLAGLDDSSVYAREAAWKETWARAKAGDTFARRQLVDNWIQSAAGGGVLRGRSIQEVACMLGYITGYSRWPGAPNV